MVHTCHATGCSTRVPPKMFMCRPDWYSLPKPLRDAIWANYTPGQEITKTPTQEYINVAQRAIRWLEVKRGLRKVGDLDEA